MINKKVSNTGKAGGHSTQIVTLEHLQDSELYNDFLKGLPEKVAQKGFSAGLVAVSVVAVVASAVKNEFDQANKLTPGGR